MCATNLGCFCEINYFWLTYVQLLAHTNLGGVSEFSQVIALVLCLWQRKLWGKTG